jgi:hypothetical protein
MLRSFGSQRTFTRMMGSVSSMVGYKGFDSQMMCRDDFKYEVGKTYTMPAKKIKLCESGFHFCPFPVDVLKYYSHSSHQYAMIHAQDKIISGRDKSVTNHMTILKLLSREELIKMMPSEIFREPDDQSHRWYKEGRLQPLKAHAIMFLNGTREWYKDGQLHREDGPAVADTNGYKAWWIKGKRHRFGGPAIIQSNGDTEWYIDGVHHRLDGPAIEGSNGFKIWYMNGVLHRLEGPAIEQSNGDQAWYKEGQLHRENGPAIEQSNGYKAWWIEGKLIIRRSCN